MSDDVRTIISPRGTLDAERWNDNRALVVVAALSAAAFAISAWT